MQPSAEYILADQERMKRARRYFRWQCNLAKHELGNRILEIGCGIGNFTDQLQDREFVAGIDVEAACIERWRRRFHTNPNRVAYVMGATDSSVLGLRDCAFDSIACLNVLEHIDNDELALSQMRNVLGRCGRVVLIVPAFQSLYGPIDARLGHYRRYTRRALIDKALRSGFQPRTVRYMNVLGFFGWWVNAKLLPREEQSIGQIAIFDSLVVPLQSAFESLLPPPFGQSLFAVFEKS